MSFDTPACASKTAVQSSSSENNQHPIVSSIHHPLSLPATSVHYCTLSCLRTSSSLLLVKNSLVCFSSFIKRCIMHSWGVPPFQIETATNKCILCIIFGGHSSARIEIKPPFWRLEDLCYLLFFTIIFT